MNKGWCRGNWLILNGAIHYRMLYSLSPNFKFSVETFSSQLNSKWEHNNMRTKQQQLTTVPSSLNADDMNVNDWRCNNEVEHFAVEGG